VHFPIDLTVHRIHSFPSMTKLKQHVFHPTVLHFVAPRQISPEHRVIISRVESVEFFLHFGNATAICTDGIKNAEILRESGRRTDRSKIPNTELA